MEIIETFGHYVENLTDTKPEAARWLLKTGWRRRRGLVRTLGLQAHPWLRPAGEEKI